MTREANLSQYSASSGGADGETPYALFVRNMVFDANEQHLKEAFAKYGEISKVAIARDARGLSRGWVSFLSCYSLGASQRMVTNGCLKF